MAKLQVLHLSAANPKTILDIEGVVSEAPHFWFSFSEYRP